MQEYIVGYFTPQGRRTTTVSAVSREAARTQVYAMGYDVMDVSL